MAEWEDSVAEDLDTTVGPTSPVVPPGRLSLTNSNLLLFMVESFDAGSTTWAFTGVEFGDGTNWASMTELGNYRYISGSDSVFGAVFYLENPDTADDRFRVTFTGTPMTGSSDNGGYVAIGITDANVGGTEADLFPNFSIDYNSTADNQQYDQAMTGGSTPDLGVALVSGYDGTNDDPVYTAWASATTRETWNNVNSIAETLGGIATNDYSNDSTISVEIDQFVGYGLIHVADAGSSGTLSDVNYQGAGRGIMRGTGRGIG